MAVTNPHGKPVRPGEVVGVYLGNGWNMRQAEYYELNPGSKNRRENRTSDSDQDGRANPDAQAAVLWVVHCLMHGIERDHINSDDGESAEVHTSQP